MNKTIILIMMLTTFITACDTSDPLGYKSYYSQYDQEFTNVCVKACVDNELRYGSFQKQLNDADIIQPEVNCYCITNSGNKKFVGEFMTDIYQKND